MITTIAIAGFGFAGLCVLSARIAPASAALPTSCPEAGP